MGYELVGEGGGLKYTGGEIEGERMEEGMRDELTRVSWFTRSNDEEIYVQTFILRS